LKIYPYIFYCTVLDNSDPVETSMFMGISQSMIMATWTMPFVCTLPISIFEPLWGREAKLTRRLAGASYRFSGLRASDLEGMQIMWHRPFWVMLTAELQSAVLVQEWS
jgi:hypothetical protein